MYKRVSMYACTYIYVCERKTRAHMYDEQIAPRTEL